MLNYIPIYKKTYFWLFLLPVALVLLWVFLFWAELSYLVRWLPGIGVSAETPAGETAPLPAGVEQFERIQYNRDTAIITLSIVFFPFFLLVSLWTVSQFVLPVSQSSDRLDVFARLILFLTRRLGPAVFVKEGEIRGSIEELQSSRPGVAFVDLTSALVLERQPFIMSTGGGVSVWERRRRSRQQTPDESETETAPRSPMVRIAGPGITFTQAGERIRGVVSLRRQFSIQPNTKSITRDGFEVVSHIVTIFSLGEPPDILRVGYFGGKPEDIFVLQVDEAKGIIKGSKDDLDLDDKQEVHRYYQHYTRFHDVDTDATLASGSQAAHDTPYTFNPDRVFKAVYADSRNPSDNSTESWLDLPSRVAVETFHNLISLHHYTDLYLPKDEKSFPLNETFKPEFFRRVRNQGVLSYQLVARKDGLPFAAGQPWNLEELDIFPVRAFQSSKLLRDRGIRIVAATLPELRPANPAVREQLLDYWRAQWERAKDTSLAPYDYEEIHLRAAARARAQSDIVKSLSELLKDATISREMAVLRLFQALEVFAREPTTEKLLPHETMHMLTTLQQLLGLSPPAGQQPAPPALTAGQPQTGEEDEAEAPF